MAAEVLCVVLGDAAAVLVGGYGVGQGMRQVCSQPLLQQACDRRQRPDRVYGMLVLCMYFSHNRSSNHTFKRPCIVCPAQLSRKVYKIRFMHTVGLGHLR